MAVWTVYLSLCLLMALTASVEANPVGSNNRRVCEGGWSSFGSRCFKFFNNHQTWIEAEKTCLHFRGNLASVHSHEEYMFLQRLVRDTTYTTTGAWIGGHDAVNEGDWLWSDGSKMNYQIWAHGEPNNHGNEHCLQMNDDNGNWNDNKCWAKMPFVCVT
ncbi:galactose-specific lectin nattectin-like [Siphateles boraxobius]|uniref:galactose-specific lectin nattectin-like n=1 Tax=Siphateles boraxobius TaxID=180520 RepID=UPI004063C219